MEVDLDLDMIGSEMIELLGGLKQQNADQPDQNSFYDNNNTQENLKKGRNNRSKDKNKDKLQCNNTQSQKIFNKHFLKTIQT